jgi:hypothetical protein
VKQLLSLASISNHSKREEVKVNQINYASVLQWYVMSIEWKKEEFFCLCVNLTWILNDQLLLVFRVLNLLISESLQYQNICLTLIVHGNVRRKKIWCRIFRLCLSLREEWKNSSWLSLDKAISEHSNINNNILLQHQFNILHRNWHSRNNKVFLRLFCFRLGIFFMRLKVP